MLCVIAERKVLSLSISMFGLDLVEDVHVFF